MEQDMNPNSNIYGTEMPSIRANSELTSSGDTATEVSTSATRVICANLNHSHRIFSSEPVTNELRENSSLSPETATILSLPNGVQMASNTSNEPSISSTQPELSYSLPNSCPPGICNINIGYECEDSTKNLGEIDPPSYEEAIKDMKYCTENPPRRVISVVSDNLIYHQYPDNGQFGAQDQYFYPMSYHSLNSSDVEQPRMPICARLVSCIVFIGFMVLAIRIIFFIQ